jgi:hypothetical protein
MPYPQFGQESASCETCLPHSGHLIKAILVAIPPLEKLLIKKFFNWGIG